mgnify:CR=1 FL=1
MKKPDTLNLEQTVGHSTKMDTFGTYGHELEGEMNRFAKISLLSCRLLDKKTLPSC